jgi:hypothetical protein
MSGIDFEIIGIKKDINGKIQRIDECIYLSL